MVSVFMELVPGLVILALTTTLIYSYVAEKDEENKTFRDWATNLVALYVGKSLSDHAQHNAARQQRALQSHAQAPPAYYHEITTSVEDESGGFSENEVTAQAYQSSTGPVKRNTEAPRRKGTR